MSVAVEFQQAFLIVAAPSIYDGLLILLGLSVVAAACLPLLKLAQLLRASPWGQGRSR